MPNLSQTGQNIAPYLGKVHKGHMDFLRKWFCFHIIVFIIKQLSSADLFLRNPFCISPSRRCFSTTAVSLSFNNLENNPLKELMTVSGRQLSRRSLGPPLCTRVILPSFHQDGTFPVDLTLLYKTTKRDQNFTPALIMNSFGRQSNPIALPVFSFFTAYLTSFKVKSQSNHRPGFSPIVEDLAAAGSFGEGDSA